MSRTHSKFDRDKIREFAVMHFSQDKFKERISDIYQEVIRNAK